MKATQGSISHEELVSRNVRDPETKDGLVRRGSVRPTNCRFGFFPKDFLSYLAQAGKLGVITGRRRRWMCSALHLSRGGAGG